MTYDASQFRATFEDTKKRQEELRIKLDTLDSKNEYVTVDERGKFFLLIADSLLGLDYEKQCKLIFSDHTILRIPNVGEFIRFLAYYEKTNIGIDFLKRYGKIDNSPIKIGEIWHELKFIIFSIYPEALAMSIRISKEQPSRESEGETTDYEEAIKVKKKDH